MMIAEIFQRERFEDPETEVVFRAQSNARKFQARTLFLFAGILFYASFTILDHLVAGNMAMEFIFLRLIVVCPLMLAIALAFQRGWFLGREGLAYVCYVTPVLASVLYMSLTLEKPTVDLYPFGMVVTMFTLTLLLLPSLRLTVLIVCLTLFSLGLVIAFAQISYEAIFTNLFFTVLCCLVLIVGMHFLENIERRQYIYKCDLEKTFTTLRQSEKRATDLYHEAKQAERAKNEFLAVVSHELRTPMNAIIGFSEIISTEMMGKAEPPQYREYATHINRSGTQLLNIINDILDISRADIDKIVFDSKPFDFGAMIDSAIMSCSANAEECGITVRNTGAPLGDMMVKGDESRLMQAMINIVGNAIKFSDEHGTVTVQTSITHVGELRVTVRDQGIGISAEDIEQIKKPFQQAESAFVRNNGGLGLGLAICNIVATAHEGELCIESTLGEGTSVSLILPPTCVVKIDEPMTAA